MDYNMGETIGNALDSNKAEKCVEAVPTLLGLCKPYTNGNCLDSQAYRLSYPVHPSRSNGVNPGDTKLSLRLFQTCNMSMLKQTEKGSQCGINYLTTGGPGTKKGKIVDNLANVFGFEVINVEKLIIQNLAKRLEEPDPNATVKAIQIMLKKEPELLKLNEVLKMLVKRLEQVNKDKFCIVDFMPNLKWMLSNATFIKECINEFRFFEEKFPISFAIHFLIPKEKVLNKLELECAKHPNATPVAAPKAESASKSDEADVGRTQKRLLLYESSVKHFLEYFVKTDKMVTVDVSCGLPDVIWCKICTFFTDFDFPATRTPETVIIFGFDANDLNEMHIEQYSLTMVNLKEIVLDANDPVDLLIDQLCKYLDSCDPTRRVFAVDSTGTTLNKTLTNRKSKKTILFHDEGGNCKLGRYCAVNITDKGDPVELQGIATLENEVCLFSKSVPLDVCIYIGSALASYRACPVKR